jgi:DinB superfamily
VERAQLLMRLEREWEALKSSYAGLTTAEMLEPGAAGQWSVKDLIAHVTWWEEEALTHLPLILSGGRPPRYSVAYGGIDAFNAKMMEPKSSLPLAEVIRQRDATHHRLTDFLQSVPTAQLAGETRFRRRLRLDTYGHYRQHAEAIRAWRGHRSGLT